MSAIFYHIVETMETPDITSVLDAIGAAYAPQGSMHNLIARSSENIRGAFATTLPALSERTARNLCTFLYEKYQEGNIKVRSG
jgi:hypothetical protein